MFTFCDQVVLFCSKEGEVRHDGSGSLMALKHLTGPRCCWRFLLPFPVIRAGCDTDSHTMPCSCTRCVDPCWSIALDQIFGRCKKCFCWQRQTYALLVRCCGSATCSGDRGGIALAAVTRQNGRYLEWMSTTVMMVLTIHAVGNTMSSRLGEIAHPPRDLTVNPEP